MNKLSGGQILVYSIEDSWMFSVLNMDSSGATLNGYGAMKNSYGAFLNFKEQC